mmetsp:Transcript_5358/g.10082  ORF Transcript_5358/g.10082 Transcript_5358/m.10082 type:complete len:85 (+) Transcript_5358:18-272(+)
MKCAGFGWRSESAAKGVEVPQRVACGAQSGIVASIVRLRSDLVELCAQSDSGRRPGAPGSGIENFGGRLDTSIGCVAQYGSHER